MSTDKMREAFEAWYRGITRARFSSSSDEYVAEVCSNDLWRHDSSEEYWIGRVQGMFEGYVAGREAAARRCVEICAAQETRVDNSPWRNVIPGNSYDCADAIDREFGLTEKLQ